MSQLAFLTQDVLTFLTFLCADNIRPLGSRYLAPTALSKLTRLLSVSDPIQLKHIRNANGSWRAGVRVRASEKSAPRIRFIHYLAEAAHLVARTGAFLKPTPALACWLTASDHARAQILFRAAFPAQPTPDAEQRWRAFGLPGDHLPAPLATLGQLLEIFRHLPTDYRVKHSTLIKLLRVPAFDDSAPSDQPAAIVAGWLTLLEWFEILTRDSHATAQITPLGATLIEHPAAPPASWARADQPLHWSTPRGKTLPDLIAPREADPARIFELSDYVAHRATLCTKTESRRVYQLESARVQSALARGISLTQIYECFERATADALPAAVDDWLTQIAAAYGRVTLRSATLLQVTDARILTELTRAQAIRQCVQATLSPRAVIIKPSKLTTLARQLERRGYPVPLAASQANASTKSFDQPTLAHLYLAARLTHQRAETYRPPYSIILDLETQLTARDRARAEEIFEIEHRSLRGSVLSGTERSGVESKDATKQSRTWDGERSGVESKDATKQSRTWDGEIASQSKAPLAGKPLAKTIQSIQHALATQTALEIVYHSPYTDATTTRLIEPMRLEYRDEIPYLIAYCHRAGAERTFRVARIERIAERNQVASRIPSPKSSHGFKGTRM
ncbi:MAG: WYL domain-containing protein, partial [Chloroflexi bacterium]|nr:WYL domain-containing protein [Chloroflexota bacterium]